MKLLNWKYWYIFNIYFLLKKKKKKDFLAQFTNKPLWKGNSFLALR